MENSIILIETNCKECGEVIITKLDSKGKIVVVNHCSEH